jgi:hypothetical protein
MGGALDLLTYPIYIFVSLTRLFFNLYTAHSDVGGTTVVLFICTYFVVMSLYGTEWKERGFCFESIATLPPFSPIDGHKWFVQISSR